MSKSGVIFAAVCIAAVVVFLIYPFVLDAFLTNSAERGQFGDMFGAVNSLFSGLAFAGVIYAVLLQREELKLQREELRENTKAQRSQAEALSFSADLTVTNASAEAIGTQIRYLRNRIGEKHQPEGKLSENEINETKNEILALKQQLEQEFRRISELRTKFHATKEF